MFPFPFSFLGAGEAPPPPELELIDNDFAMEFIGTDEYVSAGDNDICSFGNGTTDSPFTLSAWINADNYPAGSACILGKDQTNSNREYVLGVWNGKVRIFIKSQGGNNQQSIDSTTSLSAGQWYHVVATYNGVGGNNAADGLTIYINGAAETPTNVTKNTYVAMSNGTSPFVIGQYFNAAFFDGDIDEVAIWSKALDATDIQTIYNATNDNPGKCANLWSGGLGTGLVYWNRMGD